MTVAPLAKNAILTSLHGDRIGLDAAGYLVGREFKGSRIATFGTGMSPIMGGQGFPENPYRHNDMFEDFLGHTLSGRVQALHGTDGTAAAALNVDKGGVLRLTTGAGSTHTMAVNGAQLTAELNWYAANNALIFEARLGKVSALTSQAVFIGLTDSASLGMPATLSTVTYTTNFSNGCGFLYDDAATNKHLNLIGVKADTDATGQSLTNDISTTAFHTYRIEVDTSENATFYIDGSPVGVVMASALTKTVALTPTVAMFSEATSVSQTLDIDYIAMSQLRV